MGKNGGGGGGGGVGARKRQSRTIGDRVIKPSQYAKKQIARKRAKQLKKLSPAERKIRDKYKVLDREIDANMRRLFPETWNPKRRFTATATSGEDTLMPPSIPVIAPPGPPTDPQYPPDP